MSVALAVVAVALWWPAIVSGVLHSWPAVGLFAAACAGAGFLLHPRLSAAFERAVDDFRKAAQEFEDNIDR